MSLSVDGIWKADVWATTVWADDVWREGAATGPGTDFGGTAGGGFATNTAGVVQSYVVDNDFTGNAGDTFIRGTRVSVDGQMYVTTQQPVGATDVFLEGLRHTVYGVRYVINSVGTIQVIDGTSSDVDGRQAVTTTVSGNANTGILYSTTGRMVVSSL